MSILNSFHTMMQIFVKNCFEVLTCDSTSKEVAAGCKFGTTLLGNTKVPVELGNPNTFA